MTTPPALRDAIGAFVPPLLETLDRIEWTQRHLDPPRAIELAAALTPRAERVAGPLQALEAAPWPDDLVPARERLVDAGRRALDLITAFAEAARSPHDPIGLYRALRRLAPLQEALYPLASSLEPVSRWFLEPSRRDDHGLAARLRAATARADGLSVGIRHAANERDTRGGLSLYVPETWDGAHAMPLVVALHGGHGHGRDFLWTWLREARTRGVLLLSPTSRGRTWSLMGQSDDDGPALREMVRFVTAQYPVDRERVLLTGMSDGATYTFLAGLAEESPFTHLAPACGVLHPMLLTGGVARARGRPIYLIHGALDWMFPPDIARKAAEILDGVGARIVYREIADLSHTYPRDENPLILDWLTAADPG